MTPETFALLKKVIDTAVQNGMVLEPEVADKFKDIADEFSAEKMSVREISEKLDVVKTKNSS